MGDLKESIDLCAFVLELATSFCSIIFVFSTKSFNLSFCIYRRVFTLFQYLLGLPGECGFQSKRDLGVISQYEIEGRRQHCVWIMNSLNTQGLRMWVQALRGWMGMRTEQEKVIRAEMTTKWGIPKVFKACFIGSDRPLLVLLCKALDACPRLCSPSLLLMDQLRFF